jgi:hypothetical protein
MADESHERSSEPSDGPLEAELSSIEQSSPPEIQFLPPGPYARTSSSRPAPEPVALQAVVDDASRLHPFRFGTRAVLVLMAACGLQCALVFYLGTLLGLLIGAATCLVVLGGLVVAAMVYHPQEASRACDVMDQLAIRLTLAVVILLMAVIVAGGGSFAWAEAVKIRRNTALQEDLGFTASSERFGGTYQNLTVDSIAPGKPFDQAGVLKGDQIILSDDELTEDEFYAMLQANRGGQVTLTVKTGGSTAVATPGQGKPRQLTVSVPPP